MIDACTLDSIYWLMLPNVWFKESRMINRFNTCRHYCLWVAALHPGWTLLICVTLFPATQSPLYSVGAENCTLKLPAPKCLAHSVGRALFHWRGGRSISQSCLRVVSLHHAISDCSPPRPGFLVLPWPNPRTPFSSRQPGVTWCHTSCVYSLCFFKHVDCPADPHAASATSKADSSCICGFSELVSAALQWSVNPYLCGGLPAPIVLELPKRTYEGLLVECTASRPERVDSLKWRAPLCWRYP